MDQHSGFQPRDASIACHLGFFSAGRELYFASSMSSSPGKSVSRHELTPDSQDSSGGTCSTRRRGLTRDHPESATLLALDLRLPAVWEVAWDMRLILWTKDFSAIHRSIGSEPPGVASTV